MTQYLFLGVWFFCYYYEWFKIILENNSHGVLLQEKMPNISQTYIQYLPIPVWLVWLTHCVCMSLCLTLVPVPRYVYNPCLKICLESLVKICLQPLSQDLSPVEASSWLPSVAWPHLSCQAILESRHNDKVTTCIVYALMDDTGQMTLSRD